MERTSHDLAFSLERCPSVDQVIALYNAAGLPRPTYDRPRIQAMFDHANLIATAWDGDTLVGVARSITDWVWSCYLADLAVHPDYQQQNIGRRLIELTRERLGEESMILLLSVPTAMEYYPKVGFERQNSAFILNRAEWRRTH